MKRKWNIVVGVLLAVAVSVGSLSPLTAKAGESQTIIDDESLDKKSNALWNNPEGDVVLQDDKILFPQESTGDTRLITKVAAKVYEELPVMFDGSYSLNLSSLPEGQEFVFACGLARIESFLGDDGNVELFFRKEGGITAGLRVYQDGEAKELVAPKKIGASEGRVIAVSVSLTTKKQYTVTVNGSRFYEGSLDELGEGRFGFLQTGKCKAEISNMKFTIYTYDTPENTNVEEHFDNGTFDCSKITTKQIFAGSYYPFDFGVQEYNGESVLMLENAGLCCLSTKYEYSNFELTFDVPYLQRKDEVDEEGNVVKPLSGWFGVTYGDEAEQMVGHGFAQSADFILFDRYSSVKSLVRETTSIPRANLANTAYDYFAEDETRGFSVLVRMVDGHIDLGIKWMDEEKFNIFSSYDLDTHSTPTGYIHIWACEIANWAMDNLVIKNLDNGAKVIETEYKNAKITVPEDYKFQRAEKEYRKSEDGINQNLWYLLIAGTAVVVAGGISIVVLVQKKKKKKGKEGVGHEI